MNNIKINSSIKLPVTFGDGSIEIKFDSKIRIADPDMVKLPSIPFYNYLFYIPIIDKRSDNDIYGIIKRIVINLYQIGFANCIPVFDKSILNRTRTMIAIDLETFKIGAIIEAFNRFKEEVHDEVNTNPTNTAILNGFIDLLTKLDKDHFNEINNKIIFIDFMNNMFNPHGTELKPYNNPENGNPILNTYQVGEFLTGEDIKLSFSEKGKGIYSVNLAHEMFTTSDFLFRPVIGSFIRVDKFGLTASYMGSLFTNDMFEDYSRLRILVELNFEPKSDDSMFNNEAEFNNFNDFINKCRQPMDYTLTPVKINKAIKLKDINITVEGTDAPTYSRTDIGLKILRSFIENNIGKISEEDFVKYVNQNFTINEHGSALEKATIKINNPDGYDDLSYFITGW